MKNIIKMFGLVAVSAAFTFSASAFEQPVSPKANRPVIQIGESSSLDTIHGQPMLGKATPNDNRGLRVESNNTDTLAMEKNCALSPKLKGNSRACSSCCKKGMK